MHPAPHAPRPQDPASSLPDCGLPRAEAFLHVQVLARPVGGDSRTPESWPSPGALPAQTLCQGQWREAALGWLPTLSPPWGPHLISTSSPLQADQSRPRPIPTHTGLSLGAPVPASPPTVLPGLSGHLGVLAGTPPGLGDRRDPRPKRQVPPAHSAHPGSGLLPWTMSM